MAENATVLLNRIKQYYSLLTGTPEPEQEEDAQKQMVPVLEALNAITQDDPKKSQITKSLLDSVKKWDPLDNWFNEVEGLEPMMKEFLMIHGLLVEDTSQKEAELKAKAMAEADAKMKELEEKMKALEEKERLLREKEKAILDKQSDTTASVEKDNKPALHSKLAAPEIKIPKIMSPKVVISPSAVEQDDKINPQSPPSIGAVPKSEPEPEVAPEPVAETESPQTTPFPNVKINIGSASATPIKINPNPIKISVPKITAMTADNAPVPSAAQHSPSSFKIQPISADQPPTIQPVSNQAPSIQPVSMQKPSFQPVSNQAPSIHPVGSENSISRPNIRPIENQDAAGGAFKPAGEVQRPSISPINQIDSSGASNAPKLISPASSTPSSSGPVNLFAQKVGDKKPVNLFAQQTRSSQDSPSAPEESKDNATDTPGKIAKVGSLDRIDFKSQAATMGAVSNEDEKYLKMSSMDLYRELLTLEAKRFHFDKSIGLVQQSFEKGQIGEAEVRGTKERLNFEIEQLKGQMNKIRNFLTAAK